MKRHASSISYVWFALLVVLYFFACNAYVLIPDKAHAQSLSRSNEKLKVKGATIYADGSINNSAPYTYGDVIILRNLLKASAPSFVKPVVFSHFRHRMTYTCKICHSDLGFKMEAGGNNITMASIVKGKWCGTCHNVKIIVSRTHCENCHSYGIEEKEKERLKSYFFNLELLELPQSGYGNMVDWVKALNDRKIDPIQDMEESLMKVLDMDIEYEVKSDNIPLSNVIFPHKEHTQWLSCSNCHPQIFKAKIGENSITMSEIIKGKFCGKCHGTVAFPILDCMGCHNQRRLEAFNFSKDSSASREE